jgi:hypothetical protein
LHRVYKGFSLWRGGRKFSQGRLFFARGDVENSNPKAKQETDISREMKLSFPQIHLWKLGESPKKHRYFSENPCGKPTFPQGRKKNFSTENFYCIYETPDFMVKMKNNAKNNLFE